MKKIIDKCNEKKLFPILLPYPKTDLQILKTYKFLSMIQDDEIQEMLKDIKLPKIDSWKDYFTLNEDGNEYYTISVPKEPGEWKSEIDEIEEAIRKGKIILVENDEGIIATVESISINLTNRMILIKAMDNYYGNIPG
jgi:hypothetical protein